MPLRGLLWLAIVAVLVARSSNAFLYPVMWGEDGTELFLYYLDRRAPSAIIHFYQGYVSLLPNLVGWSVAWLPLGVQPYALALAAAFLSAGVFSWLASPRFDWIVAHPARRAALGFVLAVLPFGNFAIDACTMYALWPLLLALLLAALARAPQHVPAAITELALLALCLASNPLSIALLPVWLLRLWHPEIPGEALARPGVARGYFAALAVCTVAYPLLLIVPGHTTPVAVPRVLTDSAGLFVDRVLIEPLLGLNGRLQLAQLAPALLWPVGIVPVLVWVGAWRRLPQAHRWALAVLLGSATVMTALAVYGRHYKFDKMLVWGQRYTYVPRYASYLALLLCGSVLLRDASRTTRRLLLCAIAAHAAALAHANAFYFRTLDHQGRRLVEFVHRAAAWRSDPNRAGTTIIHREPTRDLVVPAPRTTATPAPPTPR